MLDLIDRKIIYHLDRNARESFASIAKKLKIGRNVVLYRVNRLKEIGLIKGSFAEINNPSLGYLTFRVFLKIGNYNESQEKSLLHFIKNNGSTMWLSRVVGLWDLDFLIMVKSLREFEEFREKLFYSYNEIISSSSISLLTQIYHYPRDYLIGEVRKDTSPTLLSIGKEVKIDGKDMELLKVLTKDGSIGILDIAAKLKLSINTIKKKIKNLENNNVILGYRLFLDAELLGYEHFKLHLNLKNYQNKDLLKLRDWLASKPFVIYFDSYINGEDFEIELHLENEKKYLKFLSELKSQFSNIIKNDFLIKFYDVQVFRYLPIE